MRTKLFLETSAQIARLSGVPECADAVRRIFLDGRVGNSDAIVYTSDVVYREFLSTIITDLVTVKNAIGREFIRKKILTVSLANVAECISQLQNFSSQRWQRLFLVQAAINRRFSGVEAIPTERLVRFLDTSARDLSQREFFEINLGDNRKNIRILKNHFLSGIKCLAKSPLVSVNGAGTGCFCMAVDDRAACPRKGSKDCFDKDRATTRCLAAGEEACNIGGFCRGKKIRWRVSQLLEYDRANLFSKRFRRKKKNEKALELLRELGEWDSRQKVPFIGRRCAYYFTDLLIFLECPSDARIISYDRDFDELGMAIGCQGLRADPGWKTSSR